MEDKFIPALTLGWLTPVYDFLTEIGGFGEKFKEDVLKRIGFKDGERLLDVGCGTGTLAILAKKHFHGAKVVGVDVDPAILRIARSKAKREGIEIEWVETSSERLPFPQQHFDVVTSTLMFHHLPTQVKHKTLREIYRVLERKGKFMLADWAKPELWWQKVLFGWSRWLKEVRYLQDNLEGKLPEFMRQAGFKVKEFKPQYRGVQFWEGIK